MVIETRHIVWQCGEHRENLRPAGREPLPGCGKLNVMRVKNYNIYEGCKIQTSPCKQCGKRPRIEHQGDGAQGNCWVFRTKAEALQFIENKIQEEQGDWF